MLIDLHCHLLPGVDDGPTTMAEAVALARALVDCGVSVVAVTPHVTWEIPTTFPAVIAGVEELAACLRDEGVALDVVTGGEIRMSFAPSSTTTNCEH